MTNARWVVGLGMTLGLAACGSSGLNLGFGVATTLVFDSSVADASLPLVRGLQIDVTGDETYAAVEALPQGAARTERFVYRPKPSSRSLIMAVAALSQDGSVLASGESAIITLSPASSTQVGIVLHGGDLFDGGLNVVDASMLGDSSIDLGPPADLTRYDASGGASRCPALASDTSVILCHGFESATEIPTVANGVITSNGAESLDATRHFRGDFSLHLSTNAQPTSESDSLVTYPFTAPVGELHARVFVYPSGTLTHTSALLSFTGMYEVTELGLQITADGALSTTLSANGTDLGASTYVKTSATKLPMNAWSCLEVVGVPSATSAGKVAVYMNETHLTDLDYSGPTESNSALWGGMISLDLDSTPGDALDVWYDELVLATVQIGCEL